MNKWNIERRNSINMNNQDIENRLQNIINADKIVSKQLAFKTKRLYKRLNVFGRSTLHTLACDNNAIGNCFCFSYFCLNRSKCKGYRKPEIT